MSVKDLFFDVDYMKQYAKNAARVITVDVSRSGMTDEQRIKDAVMARYQLDSLLLDNISVAQKWAQSKVQSFKSGEIVFKGSYLECIKWLYEKDNSDNCMIFVLPYEPSFDWAEYIAERGIPVGNVM